MKTKLSFLLTLLTLNSLFSQTFNTLFYETFGSGANITTPGIAPSYCWNNQNYPEGSPCGNNAPSGFSFPSSCGSYTLEDNQYVVTSAINPNNCNWFPYRDHTSNGGNLMGRFLAINIGSLAGNYGVLYSKSITNIIPNQLVRIELYVANLLKAGAAGDDPDLLIELVGSNNTVVASSFVGIIDNFSDGWQYKQVALNPANNTSLTFRIRAGSNLFSGNDVVIDDIKVFQLNTLGVSETIFNNLTIYPIPVTEMLHIDNVAIEKAFVYDTLGHLVKTATFNSGINNVFDLKGLPKGIYFLNLQSEDILTTKKIIVE
jgi:acetyltransferase-like isoleucine patch superfamily enzyme